MNQTHHCQTTLFPGPWVSSGNSHLLFISCIAVIISIQRSCDFSVLLGDSFSAGLLGIFLMLYGDQFNTSKVGDGIVVQILDTTVVAIKVKLKVFVKASVITGAAGSKRCGSN